MYHPPAAAVPCMIIEKNLAHGISRYANDGLCDSHNAQATSLNVPNTNTAPHSADTAVCKQCMKSNHVGAPSTTADKYNM